MTQLKTRLRGGFTLVELIVVITILAILGTIGFMSFQGYTANARNTKRTSDIGSIASALTVKKAGSALAITEFVDSTTTNATFSGAKIAGQTYTVASTAYKAGAPNYAVLGIKKTEFLDPSNGLDYRLGATTFSNGAYEVAATLEVGDVRNAAIKGEWSPRKSISITGGKQVGPTGSKKFSVAASDGVKLDVGDQITINAAGTYDIVAISSDSKYITFSGTALTGTDGSALAGAVALKTGDESDGLILSTTANTPVQKDTTYVPYSLN